MFLSIVQCSYIKWFSDNQAACSIVQVGSMSHDPHIIAINIFNLCAANNIELDIQWIRRNELEKADFIGSIIDIDDWQFSYGIFLFLDNSWGLHTFKWLLTKVELSCA